MGSHPGSSTAPSRLHHGYPRQRRPKIEMINSFHNNLNTRQRQWTKQSTLVGLKDLLLHFIGQKGKIVGVGEVPSGGKAWSKAKYPLVCSRPH